MRNLLIAILTAVFIIGACKQKVVNEQLPYVAPFVDAGYARQKAEEFKKGNILFGEKCRGCHVSPDMHSCPDMFENLFENLPSPAEEYFAKYIRDEAGLRKSGDKYANKLYEAYNRSFSHAFSLFSQNDIDQLIVYIQVASKAGEHGRRLVKNK